MKVLIIEDEEAISRFIKKGLESESFVVDVADDGEQGLEYALTNSYDLIFLDMYLPKLSGMKVAENIRQRGQTVPIIVLTVEPSVDVKVKMLNLCDDYMMKPFLLEELIARARAILRRGGSICEDVITVGDLSIDIARYQVKRKNKIIELRNKEFALLECFMRDPGVVFSRGELLSKVWGVNADPFTNTIDVHVRYLRKKIDEGYKKKMIQTVSGRGYKLEA